MGKNFTLDYPFTEFSSVQFYVEIPRVATAITKSYFGFWEEKIYARYGDKAHYTMRFNWSKNIMNLAKKFSADSEYIDVVAMNWNGFHEIRK